MLVRLLVREFESSLLVRVCLYWVFFLGLGGEGDRVIVVLVEKVG